MSRHRSDRRRSSTGTTRSSSHTLGRSLRLALPVTALVGAVLGVTAFGPGAFSALASGLHHRGDAAIVVPPSVVPLPPVAGSPAPLAAIITSAPASAPNATTPGSTPDATPSTTAERAPAATAAPVTTPAVSADVTTIQVVPAARDLIVQIDGVSYASTSDGTIAVPASARHGSVTFVGFREAPALREASFGSWADGSTAATRSLDSLPGPVVQLGITISYRITVAAAGAAGVDFFASLGPLSIPVATPTWVPAAQAVSGQGGLVAQSINYTVQSIDRDGQQIPVTPVSYAPIPEALWNVATT